MTGAPRAHRVHRCVTRPFLVVPAGKSIRGWSRSMTLDVQAAPEAAGTAPPPAAADRIESVVAESCARLPGASAERVVAEARRGFYPDISDDEVELALVMAARSFVEAEVGRAHV